VSRAPAPGMYGRGARGLWEVLALAAEEQRPLRRRMGYFRKTKLLATYVRVDEHAREGEGGDKGRE